MLDVYANDCETLSYLNKSQWSQDSIEHADKGDMTIRRTVEARALARITITPPQLCWSINVVTAGAKFCPYSISASTVGHQKLELLISQENQICFQALIKHISDICQTFHYYRPNLISSHQRGCPCSILTELVHQPNTPDSLSYT